MSGYIYTVEDFHRTIAGLTAPPGLDFETNGRRFHEPDARLVGIGLALPVQDDGLLCAYIPIAHQYGLNCDPAVMAAFTTWLEVTPVVPFHLATEVTWAVSRLGVTPRIAGDAYCAARLLQLEARSLEDLTRAELGRDSLTLAALLGHGWYDFSVLHAQDPRVFQYVTGDAVAAYELDTLLGARLRGSRMQAVYELELMAGMLMAEQEAAGYYLDRGAFEHALAIERDRVEKLERKIYVALGAKFNLNAPQQLGHHLKKLGVTPQRTKLGNESWSIESLQKLDQPYPVVKDIIDWKKSFSVMNGLTRAPIFPDASGRIWPTWMPLGWSGTPRIYSEKPSLTSLPKAGRAAFVAPPGKRWCMVAYLQPEMRALAELAGETNMIALLNTTYDFYMTVGATVRGAKPGAGTEADRTVGKDLMYAALDYAGDSTKVGQRLGLDGVHSMALVYELFPELATYFERVREQVASGSVRSYLHRQWRLIEKSGEDADTDRVSSGMGALVQHTVASWLKFVMVKVASQAEQEHPALTGFGQLLPVFDRFFYVIDEAVPVTPHLAYMAAICEPTFGKVQFRAEYGVGPSWGAISVIEELAFAQMLADFNAANT